MIIRRCSETTTFAADEAMTIRPLLPDESPQASLVTGHLNGLHPTRVNHRSDKLYLVISGEVAVTTGSGDARLGQGDALLVPAGEPIALHGKNAEIVIVCTPAFNGADEEIL
jgi:mannose-6-phosphate isomerase-like protein (cupin superfamily)